MSSVWFKYKKSSIGLGVSYIDIRNVDYVNLNMTSYSLHPFFSKILFTFIFRERGKEEEREGEIHQCVVASCTPRTGDLACNPGMCPDWESNQQPFGSQASTQSTEPHQPGPFLIF